MKMVSRLVACLAVLALVSAGAAFGGRGDPQEKLTASDNARARSMLLRKADLGPGFRATPADRSEDSYCRALDESDLTVTGRAISPSFRAAIFVVSSYADLYESLADANSSWQRGTSQAGQECLRELSRQEIQGARSRFVSFGKTALPRIAQRSIAYRIIGERDGVRVYADLIALQHSRAFAAIVFGSAYAPVPREAQVRFARLVAQRMKTAMRG